MTGLGSERMSHGSGHGLGLAIVTSIATAHAASLTAQALPEGGLAIEVSFESSQTPRGADCTCVQEPGESI